jgi:nucleotide-binding universal stress UspA family protein
MKILVPVDYSDHSRTVVDRALELARALFADVCIVHVWETQPKVPPNIKVTLPDGRTSTIAELIHEEAEQGMSAFLATVKIPVGVTVSHRILSGAAADALVREAEEGGFDLIVMGTQGRSGLGRLVLGSVAERVLRSATVPVLAVPARKPAQT